MKQDDYILSEIISHETFVSKEDFYRTKIKEIIKEVRDLRDSSQLVNQIKL